MRLPTSAPRAALAVDAATAGVFTAVVLVELGLHWDDGYSAGSLALNLPLFLLITLPLAARRRAPSHALAVAFGSVAVSSLFVAHTLFFFGGLLPLTLLVYSAARYADTSSRLVGRGPVALLITYPLHVPAVRRLRLRLRRGAVRRRGWPGAWFGGWKRQRRLLADALAAQSREQAARERALLLDERARIARELHDVVAHAVSVMVVQAGAARFALGTDEEEVRERLLSVETTGRSAVDDLRRLLEVLRADDDGAAADGPQPGSHGCTSWSTGCSAPGCRCGCTPRGCPPSCRRWSTSPPTGWCRRRSPTCSSTPPPSGCRSRCGWRWSPSSSR